SRVEQAEALLMREGFAQVRVRLHGDLARIEVSPSDIPLLAEESRREHVVNELNALGFHFVTLDLQGYRAGGGN
ncbi:MAG: TIGR00268 family protein, partial [Nitrospira sp.]|nr:TIGR00268 family protein [Nitrospira sp.]